MSRALAVVVSGVVPTQPPDLPGDARAVVAAAKEMEMAHRRFRRYRKRYRGRGGDERVLLAALDGDAALVDMYHAVVCPAICAPYMFSDHANKTFARQYAHLLRVVAPSFERAAKTPSQPIRTLMLAVVAHATLRALPPELYAHIHAYSAQVEPRELLLRAMAIATNAAVHAYN